jgi:gluconokinase
MRCWRFNLTSNYEIVFHHLPAAHRMSTVLDDAVLEDRPEVDPAVLAASLRAESDGPIVMAFDIGTSGVRAGLFDRHGEEIKGAQISLSHGVSELIRGADSDPDSLVESTIQAIDVAVARAELFVSRVDYVAASCFWHSLVGVGRRGKATTPLFGWADTRAVAAVADLKSKFDETEIHQRNGARFHPSYWPAKLRWLSTERSASFRETDRWLSFSDYLFLHLFGSPMTSVSMASATGLFDQHNVGWDRQLAGELGLNLEHLPPVAGPGQTCQALTGAFATRWPLLDGAVWFPAIGDGAANNIGAGCVTSERAALMIGTSGAMRVLFSGATPRTLPPELFCYRADRDRLVVGGALSDGGGLYRWMKETLSFSDPEEIEDELAQMEPDSHGLTVLPFWSGERAPGWSSSAQGCINGLKAGTKSIEILRAMMEAICYRFALLARALDSIAPKAAIVAAGNALIASPAWTQMLSDVLARPIELTGTSEASSRGAALLALEAAGKIEGIETIAAESSVIYEPDMAHHRVYLQAIERQERLYDKLINQS